MELEEIFSQFPLGGVVTAEVTLKVVGRLTLLTCKVCVIGVVL
jgi:hypothetical protein